MTTPESFQGRVEDFTLDRDHPDATRAIIEHTRQRVEAGIKVPKVSVAISPTSDILIPVKDEY